MMCWQFFSTVRQKNKYYYKRNRYQIVSLKTIGIIYGIIRDVKEIKNQ